MAKVAFAVDTDEAEVEVERAVVERLASAFLVALLLVPSVPFGLAGLEPAPEPVV
jgi:hypothetical protein